MLIFQIRFFCCLFLFFFFFFSFSFFYFFNLKYGLTPLYVAACNGDEQIVEILLEKGKANVDLPNKVIVLFVIILNLLILFLQSLQWKWRRGSGWILSDICFVFSFFKDSFFFFDIFFPKFGWTPLHRAAEEGFEQIVKILIEHRANVNLQNQVFSFFFFFFFFVCGINICGGVLNFFFSLFFFFFFFCC